MVNIEMSVEDARFASLIIGRERKAAASKLASWAELPEINRSLQKAYYGGEIQRADRAIIEGYVVMVEALDRILEALDTEQ